MTSDGATLVHTPEGRFIIRSRPDGYDFEFQDVARRNFCATGGRINGTMTVKRECSVTGFSNAGES